MKLHWKCSKKQLKYVVENSDLEGVNESADLKFDLFSFVNVMKYNVWPRECSNLQLSA